MGPAFGAAMVLAMIVTAFVLQSPTTSPLRTAALWLVLISVFNLLPLGILDGGRIVTSISYSTHRVVGLVASAVVLVLAVLATVALRSVLLGLLAVAAFLEMRAASRQRLMTKELARIGCDRKRVREAIVATWQRLGTSVVGRADLAVRKAGVAKRLLRHLQPFFSGQIDTPRMRWWQVGVAAGLYVGTLLFFLTAVGVLVLGLGTGAQEAYNRGDEAYQRGDLAAAVGAYEEALEKNPGFSNARVCLASVLMRMDRFDDAVSQLRLVLESDPTYPGIYIWLGAANRCCGNEQLAIEQFTKAIQLDPADAAAYRRRAEAYWSIGDFDNAWADVRVCHQLGGNCDGDFIENLKHDSRRSP
jgi:tetratricopeptide (TPR) repeat protein